MTQIPGTARRFLPVHNQQIPPQQRGRRQRTISHAAQGQRHQRNNNQRITKDYGRQIALSGYATA